MHPIFRNESHNSLLFLNCDYIGFVPKKFGGTVNVKKVVCIHIHPDWNEKYTKLLALGTKEDVIHYWGLNVRINSIANGRENSIVKLGRNKNNSQGDLVCSRPNCLESWVKM